jgi:hypothetical protein
VTAALKADPGASPSALASALSTPKRKITPLHVSQLKCQLRKKGVIKAVALSTAALEQDERTARRRKRRRSQCAHRAHCARTKQDTAMVAVPAADYNRLQQEIATQAMELRRVRSAVLALLHAE